MSGTEITPPESVLKLFMDAGWHPGRTVTIPASIEATHPAFTILTSFGGLRVGQCGAGLECATGDVNFHYLQSSSPGIWTSLLNARLIGIAEVHDSYADLFASSDGRIFELSSIDNEFCLQGLDFRSAMESILLGKRARPMLRPDQTHVVLYGEKLTTSDPQVYHWEK